jgi:hypothetical protein
MVGGSYQMEVKKGLVYPHQTLLDGVQIDASAYVLVKVDMVHENVKNIKLEVPPDNTTLTLQDASTIRVQWRRTFIDVDPSTAASASTTTSQPHTTPGSIFTERQPDQTHLCPSPIRDQPCPSLPQTQSTLLSAPDRT